LGGVALVEFGGPDFRGISEPKVRDEDPVEGTEEL